MLTKTEYQTAQRRAAAMIRRAGIHLKDSETETIEVVDFGLGNLAAEGVQVLTFFATERLSAKVLVLFPNQTEPEHWHPPVGDDPGKEETIRAVWGTLRFYVPGPDTFREGFFPEGKSAVYTCRHEVVLRPGDQLTLPPGTPHWFQTGDEGAVMYSFSTCVRDGLDRFTDPAIVRLTQIQHDLAQPA